MKKKRRSKPSPIFRKSFKYFKSQPLCLTILRILSNLVILIILYILPILASLDISAQFCPVYRIYSNGTIAKVSTSNHDLMYDQAINLRLSTIQNSSSQQAELKITTISMKNIPSQNLSMMIHQIGSSISPKAILYGVKAQEIKRIKVMNKSQFSFVGSSGQSKQGIL